MRRRSDGRYQGFFTLIASFALILLVLAKPLSSGHGRLIAAVPLPGVAGIERILWMLGVTDHDELASVFTGATDLQSAGTGHPVCLLFWQGGYQQIRSGYQRGCPGIWR